MITKKFSLIADNVELDVNGYADACQTASNLLKQGNAKDVHIIITYSITDEPADVEW